MEKRIELIKDYLNQEANAYIIDEMSDSFINQLCEDFNVSESEIVGFYEDVMQLGGAIFASLRSRHNTRGVLFLKDKFLYNKGFLHGITEMPYEKIRFVERNIASTVIYTGEYNEDGTNETLKLGGLSFEESSPVPILIEEIRNLNEETVEIDKTDKLRDVGIRAKKVINYIVDEGVKSYEKAQAQADAMADEIIANEPPKYAAVSTKEEAEKLRKQREAVEKAKAYKAKREQQMNQSYSYDDEDEDDEYDDYDYEYDADEEDDYEDIEEETDEQEVDNTEVETEEPKEVVAEKTNTSKENSTQSNKYFQLIEYYSTNKIKDEMPTDSRFSAFHVSDDIWMYLNRKYDDVSSYFYNFNMVMAHYQTSRILLPFLKNVFCVPNAEVYLGFSENGLNNLETGFALNKDYLFYREKGKRASNVPITNITSVKVIDGVVVVNDEIKISVSQSPFSAELIADIINLWLVKFLKRKWLI